MEAKVEKRKGNIGSLALGLFIGGMIGATVALLSAPQSGAQTREMIRDKSLEIRDRAMETAGGTRERAQQVITSVRGQAGDIIQKTRDRAIDLTRRGNSQTDEQASETSSMAQS
ncbi:MAG: YtxH domain-containing protein [Chloroflexi bacterium]|nr:YtxH domain-containing protein [Chloroflexota bacterium]